MEATADDPEVRRLLIDAYWLDYRRQIDPKREARIEAEYSEDPGVRILSYLEQNPSSAGKWFSLMAERVQGDEEALAYMGAGVVEAYVLEQTNPEEILRALDKEARTSISLRLALSHVWVARDPSTDKSAN